MCFDTDPGRRCVQQDPGDRVGIWASRIPWVQQGTNLCAGFPLQKGGRSLLDGSSLGIGDMVQATISSICPRNPSAIQITKNRGTNEAVKGQRAGRKQGTSRYEVVAIAKVYQIKNRSNNMTKIDTAFGSTISRVRVSAFWAGHKRKAEE